MKTTKYGKLRDDGSIFEIPIFSYSAKEAVSAARKIDARLAGKTAYYFLGRVGTYADLAYVMQNAFAVSADPTVPEEAISSSSGAVGVVGITGEIKRDVFISEIGPNYSFRNKKFRFGYIVFGWNDSIRADGSDPRKPSRRLPEVRRFSEEDYRNGYSYPETFSDGSDSFVAYVELDCKSYRGEAILVGTPDGLAVETPESDIPPHRIFVSFLEIRPEDGSEVDPETVRGKMETLIDATRGKINDAALRLAGFTAALSEI